MRGKHQRSTVTKRRASSTIEVKGRTSGDDIRGGCESHDHKDKLSPKVTGRGSSHLAGSLSSKCPYGVPGAGNYG